MAENKNLDPYLDLFYSLTKNYDFADIRILNSESNFFSQDNGKIKRSSSLASKGFGIRILKDNKWYFSSSTSLSKESIKKAISIVESPKAKSYKFELPVVRESSKNKWKKDIRFISNNERMEILNELYQYTKNKKIDFVESFYHDTFNSWIVANNFGSLVSFVDSYVTVYLDLFVGNGKGKIDIKKSFGGRGSFEIVNSEGIKDFVKDTINEVIKLRRAKPINGGVYDVVLDSAMSGVYAHEAIGHALEADSVAEGTSILLNVNKQIGPNNLNVIDDPTIDYLYGSYEFDQEGNKAKKKFLIKDGFLDSNMNSIETAIKLSQRPTGSGRSESFYNIPLPRMSNTFIEKGDFSDDIFCDIKNGLALFGFQYGYTDPITGNFSFKSQYGRKIIKGKLGEYVRDVTLSGNTLDILNRIDAIGKEVNFELGDCGKNNQWVPVTSGGPKIRIRKVVAGGQ